MLKLSELRPGDRLVAGEGHLCLKAGQVVEVIETEDGLAVNCGCGPHLLGVRNTTRDGAVVGFTRAEAGAAPARARGKGRR
jgi:hypothetical protein